MTVLLDTNAISELTRPAPDAKVAAYVGGLARPFVSVITIHELHYGIERLPAGRRRDDLARFLAGLLATFKDNILPIRQIEAERAAELRAHLAGEGRTLEPTDALIAATALVHGLTLVTRDVRDFEHCGVDLHNPWDNA